MESKLHYTAISPVLLSTLRKLMAAKEFDFFRLVGGTALGLYRGHRVSDDIDMFSDAEYDSIDFTAIDSFLRKTFTYADIGRYKATGMGKSYFVGENKNVCIKLDLFYTDRFIQKFQLIDSIRLATVEEIIAMKMDSISRGGRKKDFWDIHELMSEYTLEDMLSFHKKRYPYNHHDKELLSKFTDFTKADDDFTPICLKGKIWEIIKLDFLDFVKPF